MKKLSLAMFVSLALCFAACSGQTANNTATDEPTTPPETETAIEETTEPEAPVEETINELLIGDTIVVENMAEITIESIDYRSEIRYDYMFLDDSLNNGEVILAIVFKLNNLGTETVASFTNYIESLSFGELFYDNKYKYRPRMWVPVDIPPLSTGTVFCYYIVPLTVEQGTEPLNAIVKIGPPSKKTEYSILIR